MNLLDLLIKISVDDQASAKVATIGTGFRGAMATMGKVAAAGAVAVGTAMVAVSSAALNAYAQYEQLVGGVDTLFKASSSTVQRYAEQAYQTAGISANRYMEISTSFAASLINSLGGDTAAAAEMANTAILDMSDNANRMGTSLEVVQEAYMSLSRGNYEMLDSLKLGYGGTKAELERLLSDAEQIAASWNALDGVTVTVDKQPYETFISMLQSGDFDVYYGETQLTADFDLRPLLSSGGSLNYGGYSSDAMSQAVSAARSGDNVAAFYQLFLEQMPIIPIAFERGQMIIRKGLIDNYAPTPYNAFASLETWTSTN